MFPRTVHITTPTLNCLRKALAARHQAFQVRALIADVLCCRLHGHARLVQRVLDGQDQNTFHPLDAAIWSALYLLRVCRAPTLEKVEP